MECILNVQQKTRLMRLKVFPHLEAWVREKAFA
jgi:hypothetical protein